MATGGAGGGRKQGARLRTPGWEVWLEGAESLPWFVFSRIPRAGHEEVFTDNVPVAASARAATARLHSLEPGPACRAGPVNTNLNEFRSTL